MNKQFIVKLMQAKQMEYQAFKELIPPVLTQRMDLLEKELMDLAREYLAAAGNSGADSREAQDKGSKVRKVNIG